MKPLLGVFRFVVAAVLLGVSASGLAGVGDRVTGSAEVREESRSGPPPVMPARVYVEDFELDVSRAKPGSGLFGRPRVAQGIVDGDPASRARAIVDQMALALVQDLVAAGVTAERIVPGIGLPQDGWLIHGEFTEMDRGNTLRRASIGFGAGKTDMEVQVVVTDLAADPPRIVLAFGTASDPSRLPGAAFSKNPYMVAAKFVLEKKAPERDIKRAAKAIVDELLKFRSPPGISRP